MAELQEGENPEGVVTAWEYFNDSSIYINIVCDETKDLIKEILESYGLAAPVNSAKGGNLDNLDIKRMDALTLISVSLLEGSIDEGSLMELIVNEDGEFDIINIGDSAAGLNDCTIYYTFQSHTYKESCVGVMLTGGTPLLERKPLTWKSVFGDTKIVHDYTKIATNCNLDNYSTHALIVYDDPHITDTALMDGVDNLYAITLDNPWDKISGWAFAMSVPDKTDDTQIKHSRTAIVPIVVTGDKEDTWKDCCDIGELVRRPTYEEGATGGNSGCYSSDQGGTVVSKGISIPLDDSFYYTDRSGRILSKFIRVEAVYIIGYQFDTLYSIPATNKDGGQRNLTSDGNIVVGSIVNTNINTIKLEEGVNYAIKYEVDATASTGLIDTSSFKKPSIIFANNARPSDPIDYGKDTKFQLLPCCPMASNSDFGTDVQTGTILPVGNTRGFLVEQVIAMVEIDSPSISIYDPEFNYSYEVTNNSKAKDIADSLEYKAAAIVTIEEPAPIVIKSSGMDKIIAQEESLKDSDPFTKQDFIDSPMEEAQDVMAKGPGLTATLSFVKDPERLLKLANNLYNYMNNSNAGVLTTYICGPGSEPVLGAEGNNDGIINEINYSYSDSSSYTISVTEGPWMSGDITSINTGLSFKTTEDVSARATIMEDLGNHIHYKVRIDGVGDRMALNTVPNLLRVGDAVTVTVHNNQVEI